MLGLVILVHIALTSGYKSIVVIVVPRCRAHKPPYEYFGFNASVRANLCKRGVPLHQFVGIWSLSCLCRTR